MKDYSEAEFLYDVRTADKKREQGDIDDETYKGQIKYFASTYGTRKKLTKQILNNRNIQV